MRVRYLEASSLNSGGMPVGCWAVNAHAPMSIFSLSGFDDGASSNMSRLSTNFTRTIACLARLWSKNPQSGGLLAGACPTMHKNVEVYSGSHIPHSFPLQILRPCKLETIQTSINKPVWHRRVGSRNYIRSFPRAAGSSQVQNLPTVLADSRKFMRLGCITL